MPQTRSGARGVATGVLALLLTALLLGHALLPDPGGIASIVESALPVTWIAVVLLLVAALMRRSVVAVALVVVLGAVWSVQYLPVVLPDPKSGTAGLTIASENLDVDDPDQAATVRSIAARHPDVIALQEIADEARQPIADALAADYPHHWVVGTIAVYSDRPLSNGVALDLGLSWKRALQVDVAAADGGDPTRLYVVHAASVRPGEVAQRDSSLVLLAGLVDADPAAHLAVVGDLNTASTDRAFVDFVSGGAGGPLAEAPVDDLGFGFTWPSTLPVVRLDHVVTRGMTTTSSSVLAANGSDHRGILVGLADAAG